MSDAIASAGICGALCGLVGVFVVLRSMSFAGHGLAHAVFGGAAIAEAAGVSYVLGAGAWAGLAALVIWQITRGRALGADAAIGIVTVSSFAIGLAVQSRSGGTEYGLEGLLFGDANQVDGTELLVVGAVAAIIAVAIVGWRRQLAFSAFDPDVARVHGIAVDRFDLLLLLAVATTVVASSRIVGTLLASALLVLPPATARLVVGSVVPMLAVSTAIGGAVGVTGVVIADLADLPPGPAVTLVATVVFVVGFVRSDLERRRTAAASQEHSALL